MVSLPPVFQSSRTPFLTQLLLKIALGGSESQQSFRSLARELTSPTVTRSYRNRSASKDVFSLLRPRD